MPLTSVVLEFSEDDLSDTTPTWQDVTDDLQDIEWWAGIDREGNDPKPGGATIRLKNTGRRWEPDFSAGEFAPNVTYGRRFRLTLNDGLGAVQEGLWYITDISIDYPAGTGYSEVTMTCADGSEVLALDDLPQMDPPDADSYDDVVTFDEPWGYWPLSDPEGTQATANIKILRGGWARYRGGLAKRRKIKVRRGSTYRTRSEAGSVAGPAGAYKNTPLLAQEGLILGDRDTAVTFDATQSEYVDIEVDDSSFHTRNSLTLECWVSVPDVSGSESLIGGPILASTDTSAFWLLLNTDDVQFFGSVSLTTSGFALTVDEPHHIVGTFDGTTQRIYVDGVERASSTTGSTIGAFAASPRLTIGRYRTGGAWVYGDGTKTMAKVAVYEHALTAERVLAHFEAGSARGYPQQTAGGRIADIATHALWAEAGIQTTGRDVQPEFKFGQAKLEEISELAHAEGPRTMFFFEGDGDPVYLGHEWQAGGAPYNTMQVTLGDTAAEVKYDGIEPQYDNETYNEVTATHEAGESVTVGSGTPPPRRANTEFTDVLLMEHNHVESLANAVLAFYEDPQLRFKTVSLNGADTTRLNHILRRDIGHLIRVKKSGLSGARIDRVANIIGKRKHYDFRADLLTCTWNLGRGFNADDGFGRLSIVGFSELNSAMVLT